MKRGFVILAAAVSLAACDDSTGPESLRYRGTTVIENSKPVVLKTTIVVRNEGDRVETISRSACPMALELHANASRDGEPIWSSWNPQWVCAAIATQLQLIPGDYYEYTFSIPVPQTVPHGMYFLSIVGVAGHGIPVGQIGLDTSGAYRI